MPKIYRISRAGLRLFYKIRHHRGHGIHSPFVFDLITRVIEEKTLYYRYKNIHEAVYNSPEIEQQVGKYELLSFRLVNYFNPKKILELGSGEGVNTLCLTAPSTKVECICIEHSIEKSKKAESLYKKWNRNIILYTDTYPQIEKVQDCIYLNLNNYQIDLPDFESKILPLSADNTFIVVKGIRTKKKNQLLWEELKNLDKVRVSLDLYNEGILFFDPKMHKKNYKISF